MNTWIEWFGTLASVLVAASLTLKNIKRLRFVNLAGSLCFMFYGLMIRAWPVVGLNLFTVIVNSYYLVRMYREVKIAEHFDVLFITPEKDEYVERFIHFHLDDIKRFNPSFKPDLKNGTLQGAEVCFILREMLPVSLVAYTRTAQDEISIVLDYAVPAYRDMKNAEFFFNTVLSRIQPKPAVLLAFSEVRAHEQYLRKLGFVYKGHSAQMQLFRKDLGA